MVGLWHEAYEVPAGAMHSMYVDMPASGLAAVTAARERGGPRAERPATRL